jgi:hippurate hydrolase
MAEYDKWLRKALPPITPRSTGRNAGPGLAARAAYINGMDIKPEIAAFADELTAWRRDFHAHPELGFEELRTSALVAERLRGWGIEVTTGLGGTGVVGTIRGRGESNRAIGLRADMDALPMQEANGFAHASIHPGKMHACGHDGHTTMLLGAARYLAQTRGFAGVVQVFFQPAEEGLGGAQRMIDDGLFERFPVDAVYAVHNMPKMPVGSFGIRAGAMMASADEFSIVITGAGGHAAMPQLAVDPIVAAGHVLVALQTLVSRNLDPTECGVVTVGTIHGGTASNVIPESVTLTGTVRTLAPAARDLLELRVKQIVALTAQAHGASAAIDYQRGFPVLVNAAEETDFVAGVATELFGAAAVSTAIAPTMGAEDFAFMLNHKPGAYAFIGQGDGGNCSNSVHNQSYDFNDAILPIGASYFARVAELALPLG